jgi:hypothetical protein
VFGICQVEPKIVLVGFGGGIEVGRVPEHEVEAVGASPGEDEARLIALGAIMGGEQVRPVAVIEGEGVGLARALPAFDQYGAAGG